MPLLFEYIVSMLILSVILIYFQLRHADSDLINGKCYIESFFIGVKTVAIGRTANVTADESLIRYLSQNHSINLFDALAATPIPKAGWLAFLLFVDSAGALNDMLNILSNASNWNSGHKFAVYSTEVDAQVTDYIKTLVRNDVMNILFVDSVGKAYTWNPFAENHCGKYPVNVVELNECETIKEQLQYEVGEFLKNCTVNLGVRILPPFTLTLSTEKDNKGFDNIIKQYERFKVFGNEIALINYVFGGTGLVYNYADIQYPSVSLNTSVPSLLNKVKNGDIEMALGALFISPNEHVLFDASYPYIYDTINAYVKLSHPINSWENLFWCLYPDVWMYAFLAHILGTIFMIISYDIHNLTTARKMVLVTFTITLGLPVHICTRRCNFNAFLLMWIWYTYFLRAGYQTALISVLTNPQSEYQAKSLDDLHERKFQLGYTTLMRGFFDDYEPNDKHRGLYKNGHICANERECHKRASIEQRFASVSSRLFYKHEEWRFTDNQGDPLLYKINDIILTVPIATVFRKGYPLVDFFNRRAQIAVHSGAMMHWEIGSIHLGEMFKLRKIKTALISETETLSDGKKILTMDNLKGIFYIYLVGCIMSVFCFMVEFLRNKRIDG